MLRPMDPNRGSEVPILVLRRLPSLTHERGVVTIRYEGGEVTWDGTPPGAVDIERTGDGGW